MACAACITTFGSSTGACGEDSALLQLSTVLTASLAFSAAFDAVPLDPRSCPGPGVKLVKLCTYRCWFSRPADQIFPDYWEIPMSTAKLQRILRFRMGSHLLPIEQGRHLRLPRHRRVCRLRHIGALGDERHMLLECLALERENFTSPFS